MFRSDNSVLKHGDNLFSKSSYVLNTYIVYNSTSVSNGELMDFSRSPQHSIRDVQYVYTSILHGNLRALFAEMSLLSI